MSVAECLMSLELGLIYGVVGVGVYLTFRIIDFPDLTGDSSFVLGASMSAVALKGGLTPWVALAVGMLAGAGAGAVTGFLHTRLRITPLLSGILVAFSLYSITLRVMGGVPNLSLFQEGSCFTALGVLPTLLLLSLLIWGVFSFLLSTDCGLALRSLGKNRDLGPSAGISVSFLTLVGLALSNGLVGLGGALFSQHERFVDISQGIGTVIIGLISGMIGGRILPYRLQWVRVLSCFLGSILYRLVMASALHSDWLGITTQDLNLVTGFLVVGIMMFSWRHAW
jgi:putative tryptophan/tyrosine transport system permease protein